MSNDPVFTSSQMKKIDVLSLDDFHTVVYKTFISSHDLNSTRMFQILRTSGDISYNTTTKKYICSCGSQFKSKAYILRHLKTKKHLSYAKSSVQNSSFVLNRIEEWLVANTAFEASTENSSKTKNQKVCDECPICFENKSTRKVSCSQCVYEICEDCFGKCINSQRGKPHPTCPFCRIKIPTHILRKYRKPTRSAYKRDDDYIPPEPLFRRETTSRLTRSQTRAITLRNARFAESGIAFREIYENSLRILNGLGIRPNHS